MLCSRKGGVPCILTPSHFFTTTPSHNTLVCVVCKLTCVALIKHFHVSHQSSPEQACAPFSKRLVLFFYLCHYISQRAVPTSPPSASVCILEAFRTSVGATTGGFNRLLTNSHDFKWCNVGCDLLKLRLRLLTL